MIKHTLTGEKPRDPLRFETDRLYIMSQKIGKCLDRAVSNSKHGTILKVDDETWIMWPDTGLTV